MSKGITTQQFTALMDRLAQAWSGLDAESALACFTPDAVYMEPPNIQFYQGHDQLRAYFGALTAGTYLRYHNVWFDEASQHGCVEFSFGVEGKPTADHGIIVIELRDGLIALWREYVRQGPSDFQTFVALDGKEWQWHIGNYP